VDGGKKMNNAAARADTIDLNKWHHAIHQVTGDMALRFNSVTAKDLARWAAKLREVAQEMVAAGKQ
jgi:endogenous inhibitor of DNA gyrase (YacG/DUF329 family)